MRCCSGCRCSARTRNVFLIDTFAVSAGLQLTLSGETLPLMSSDVSTLNVLTTNSNVSAPSLNFHSLLREDRVFPPPAAFAAKAWIGSEAEYDAMYKRSIEDPEGFWADAASELDWSTKWDKVLSYPEDKTGAGAYLAGLRRMRSRTA
jgi:hypothetical protein